MPNRFGSLFEYYELSDSTQIWDAADIYKMFGEGTPVSIYCINKNQGVYLGTNKQLSQMQLKSMKAVFDFQIYDTERMGMREMERILLSYEARDSWRMVHGTEPKYGEFESFLEDTYTWEIWLEKDHFLDGLYKQVKGEI